MLALPYKAYDYRFNGDFLINSRPVLVGESLEYRESELQVDADTALFLEEHERASQIVSSSQGVLELGSGCGVVSIAASHLNAKSIYATDLSYCLPLLKRSAALSEATLEAEELDWENPSLWRPELRFDEIDLIVAADVVWLSHLAPLLVDTIARLVDRFPAAVVLLSHQTRSEGVDRVFFEGLVGRGLEVMDVSDWSCSLEPSRRMGTKLRLFAIGKNLDGRNVVTKITKNTLVCSSNEHRF